MSRSFHNIRGKQYPAKSRKKTVKRKRFGQTSGVHSGFDAMKEFIRVEFEKTPPESPWYERRKHRWEELMNRSYPIKGLDYIKY